LRRKKNKRYRASSTSTAPIVGYDLTMEKTPPDTMVDQVVMLLSTDWFLPYWSLIGIEADEERLCVQKGCRQIVHEVMNGATDYYSVNFSYERLRATRRSVHAFAFERSSPLKNTSRSSRLFLSLMESRGSARLW
jgi:hypothetical protein